MGRLEKVIYIADYIEQGRVFASSGKIRRMLGRGEGLDELLYSTANEKISYLEKRKLKVHSATYKMAASLKKQIKK